MSSVLDTLMERLSGSNLQEMSRQLGADEQTTGKAVSTAVPTLLAALARNASDPKGASALRDALARDHDGSALDDPTKVICQPEAAKGSGILEHVLGKKRSTVERGIGAATGLGDKSTGSLLEMLAPMVMGALGKKVRSDDMDTSQLAGLLGKEREHVAKAMPVGGASLERLLDADGDGDVDLADVVKKGSGLLGKVLGR